MSNPFSKVDAEVFGRVMARLYARPEVRGKGWPLDLDLYRPKKEDKPAKTDTRVPDPWLGGW